MTNLLKHRELIEEFFDKSEELSHLAGTIAVLTGEQDFMAMDVLTRMLITAMCNGDLEALTKVMADFAVRNSNQGKHLAAQGNNDAIQSLIDDTQNQRGVN
jgi:hypothetical protein